MQDRRSAVGLACYKDLTSMTRKKKSLSSTSAVTMKKKNGAWAIAETNLFCTYNNATDQMRWVARQPSTVPKTPQAFWFVDSDGFGMCGWCGRYGRRETGESSKHSFSMLVLRYIGLCETTMGTGSFVIKYFALNMGN
eukprot:scaffold183_cov112-Cylindrotheca_fusiformis.AAC.3